MDPFVDDGGMEIDGMDNFMDKLAQKLTAQEMITANSAAEVEEVQMLKSQIVEYNACLSKLQETNDEIKKNNERLGKLVSENIAPQISRLIDESTAKIEKAALDGTSKLEGAKIDTAEIERLVQESKEKIKLIAEESLKKIEEIQISMDDDGTDELKQSLEEKLDGSKDYVHRECVKVYRNVQAVVTEESGKQTEQLENSTQKVYKKVKTATLFAILAFLTGTASLIVQVLKVLGIF